MEKNNSNLKLDQKRICITGGSGFIGSNLIQFIKTFSKNSNILNLDINAPRDKSQLKFWKNCNLNNKDELRRYLNDFSPNYVINLAADATMSGKTLDDDYMTNIKGVENLINAVKDLPNDSSIIFTSSQHVKKPGTFSYINNKEYNPLGLYGQSKVLTEKIVKNANLNQNWFIVRPTLVWGPGNLVMAKAIFRYIDKNIYYHPKNDNTVRSYGYIDNICYQILKLCSLDSNLLEERIFYLADSNLMQIEWISLASNLMGKGDVKTVSKTLLKTGSLLGDYIKKIYPSFPLYTERYLNLTTSNPVPLEKTFATLGVPPVGLYEAMVRTTNWVKNYRKK